MSSNATSRRLMSLLGLCAINLVASIDATALSVSLPVIALSLNATAVQSFWAGTSFVLGSAVFQPVFAALANAFGRKVMVVVALVIFAAGTIVCSAAPGIDLLLLGRTIQGVGGGGLLTMTYVVIADLYSLQERSKGLAAISLVWLLGTVCGPVTGGGFSAHISWRWIFWLVLPFVAISLVLIAAFLKTSHKKLHPSQALKQIDWLGAVLLVASLTGLLMAISWGGSLFPWSSWRAIVSLCLGSMGLVAFVLYEAHTPAFPIMPLTVFYNQTAAAAFLGAFVLGLLQFGLLYYLPLYYQVVKGYDPLISGLALLPECFLSGPTTAITGIIIAKTGKYRSIIWIGWALFTTGCGLLVLLDADTTIAQWIFINIVSGLGLGMLFTSQSIATQAATDEQHKAIVSGLTPFLRTVGQALGIVICGSIFQNAFRSQLLASQAQALRIHAEELVVNAASVKSVMTELQLSTADAAQLVTAYNQALRKVWWALMAFSGVAGLTSLCIKQISLDRTNPAHGEPTYGDVEKSGSVEVDVKEHSESSAIGVNSVASSMVDQQENEAANQACR